MQLEEEAKEEASSEHKEDTDLVMEEPREVIPQPTPTHKEDSPTSKTAEVTEAPVEQAAPAEFNVKKRAQVNAGLPENIKPNQDIEGFIEFTESR